MSCRRIRSIADNLSTAVIAKRLHRSHSFLNWKNACTTRKTVEEESKRSDNESSDWRTRNTEFLHLRLERGALHT